MPRVRCVGWNSTSGSMFLVPSLMMVRFAPALKSPSLGIEAAAHRMLDCDTHGVRPVPYSDPVTQSEPTIVDTVENSVCSKQPDLAECPSMECQCIDRMWPLRVVLGLGAHFGEPGASPLACPAGVGLRPSG